MHYLFQSKLACAYILSLEPEQKGDWKSVYDLDLENDARVINVTRTLMEKIREEILDSQKKFGSLDELTESGEAVVNIMTAHLSLLDKACE